MPAMLYLTDTQLIAPKAQKISRVVTMSEGCVMGGMGSGVAEMLLASDIVVPIKRHGVPDILVDRAKPDRSFADLGLTPTQIAETVRTAF